VPAKKKDLKLLFVNSCLRPGGFTKVLPVGLGSVMTYFAENGYKFTLLDLDINEYDDAYVEKYLQKNNFDFILAGTIVTHYKWMKWFVNTAKKHQPNSKIIVGNSVAGSIPELFLNKTKADIVVLGEGEISAYEAVEAIRLEKNLSSVEGIAFRNKSGDYVENNLRKAAKINDLPMINWDFFDVNRYLEKPDLIPDKTCESSESNRAMPVITARGCAFKCTFCHYMFWDDPYRNKSPDKILDEIEIMINKYNASYIQFWDDLSFASAKQAEKLCDKILERGLKFKWIASVRVDLFSRSKLEGMDALRVAKKMKQAGCYSVGFALESGNPEILKMMNKDIEADAFYHTVKILKDAEITCHTSVVFGYPIENKETIAQTFEQCFKAEVYPSIGFLLPLPSTGMYDYAKLHGFITDEDKYLESITERQDICLNMTKLSNDEIMTEIKKGAKKLNDMLDLGLNENTYVKTGSYQNGKVKKKKLPPIDVKNMERIENDVSFNYASSEFKMDSSKAHLKKKNI
jgi:anaerobic magnesium-protoporphyrin IX monomethyl ester cyclase